MKCELEAAKFMHSDDYYNNAFPEALQNLYTVSMGKQKYSTRRNDLFQVPKAKRSWWNNAIQKQKEQNIGILFHMIFVTLNQKRRLLKEANGF